MKQMVLVPFTQRRRCLRVVQIHWLKTWSNRCDKQGDGGERDS